MVKLWIYHVITVFKPNSIRNYKCEGYGDFVDLEFPTFIVTEVNIKQKSDLQTFLCQRWINLETPITYTALSWTTAS